MVLGCIFGLLQQRVLPELNFEKCFPFSGSPRKIVETSQTTSRRTFQKKSFSFPAAPSL
jgi:hypothetical protein